MAKKATSMTKEEKLPHGPSTRSRGGDRGRNESAPGMGSGKGKAINPRKKNLDDGGARGLNAERGYKKHAGLQ